MTLTALILLFAGVAAAQNTPVFPSRAVTNGDLFVATNNFATTLLTGIATATATSATVASATGLAVPAIVTIDTEIFAVCRVTGNTLTFGKSSCPNADGRGYDGSVAVNHLAGRPVEARVVAGLHNQAAAEVIALENSTPVVVSDLGSYATLSAANAVAVSAGRALAISKSWMGAPSQTLGSVTFVKGGMIQPASGQIVTFTGPVECAPDQQCFDISLAGPGSIKFTGKMSAPVYATWFGAVCNGVLDPAAGKFHDDYPALMSAHSSLPLNQLAGGGMTPSGTPLPAGTVIIPDTATLASGPNGGCVIAPSDPGLYWSPFVRLQSSSSMFNAIIAAAQGFAPQVGGNYTITGINNCGGGVTCTVQVASTAGLANGDTVELHGIAGFGVAGPWQLNSWANSNRQGYNLSSGMWAIANVTATTFDLVGSGTDFATQAAWVSGWTAVKGTEKFLLTLINIHDGMSAYPVDNYNVNIGDISFYAQASNNQFASGLFCNCSVSTWIHHDLISVPYRAFVAAIGIDNVTVDDLLISSPTTRTNGPDGQAVSIITNDPLETFATHFRNLKVNGATYKNWTPALSIGGGATTFHLDVADFEFVAWPIAVNIGGQVGQNISLEHITAKTDNFVGPCPTPMLNTVVAILNPSVNNQVGTGINVSGDFQCFTNSITQGSAPANLTQVPGMPVPQGPNDFKWLPLTYDDNNFVTHSFLAAPWVNTLVYDPGLVVTCAIAVCTTQTGSSLMYVALGGTTGNRPDISPSSWAVTTGAPSLNNYAGLNVYVNGGYAQSPWFAPNSINWLVPGNPQGFRCFKDIFGTGAPSSLSTERLLMTTSDCTATGTPSDQNRFIEMRPPGSVACPNNGTVFGYGLCLDGDGKVGTGMGGNLLLKGTELNLGIPFSQLPQSPVPPGMRVWVTDGTPTAPTPCTGSGNGAWGETTSTAPSTFQWVCR